MEEPFALMTRKLLRVLMKFSHCASEANETALLSTSLMFILKVIDFWLVVNGHIKVVELDYINPAVPLLL